MNEVVIQAEPRESTGKNASRRLRHEKKIPAVVYGGGREPEGVVLDPRTVEAALSSDRGLNSLIHLRIGDRELKRMVMIRDIQRHPVTDLLLHADFVRIDMEKKVQVSVPISLTGVALGVKNEGGMLDFVNRSIEIEVFPNLIPGEIELDVSELHLGQHLEASDVDLPEGATLLTPPTETICTVTGHKEEAEPTDEDLDEAAEVDAGDAADATPKE